MKNMLCRLTFIFILLFAAGCQKLSPPDASISPQLSYFPLEDWQTSTPEQQGMDSGRLADMFAAIQAQGISLHSLLIVRNGYLVVGAYYPPYTPEARHTIQSNTKSVLGTLIGIAIDQGKIKSTEQKLVEFFPYRFIQNLDEKKKAITLGDLLSMTPGLNCEDGTPAADAMFQTQDWIQYMLDLPMNANPGEKWIYCSGASHLLSAVLKEATGMDARTYANLYLFPPLGIPEVSEMDWGADPRGVTDGVAGLYLTPEELARYGYLYLNKGAWDGRPVVSEKWVEASTREQAYIGGDPYVAGLDRRFGYMFSVFPDLKYYGYLGRAGQELYVLPDKNMVVVFTASLKLGEEPALLKLVNDYIVPSALSNQSLPASAESTARLQAALNHAAGSKQPVAPFPQTALDISEKTYLMDQNPNGWESMTFIFQPGSDEAVLRLGGAPDLKIGLDSAYRLNEIPGSRPVGMRGAWKTANEFHLDYVVLGDFVELAATIKFEADEINISLFNLNFGGQPQLFHGILSD